jgi:hypothetical protein
MIGDTKETLSAKTGRPVREIYEDEVSAVVVHGDDIDTLEGWQWDLSKITFVAKCANYDAKPGVIQFSASKRSYSRERRPSTSSKLVTCSSIAE